jgi:hypothetical protein
MHSNIVYGTSMFIYPWAEGPPAVASWTIWRYPIFTMKGGNCKKKGTTIIPVVFAKKSWCFSPILELWWIFFQFSPRKDLWDKVTKIPTCDAWEPCSCENQKMTWS